MRKSTILTACIIASGFNVHADPGANKPVVAKKPPSHSDIARIQQKQAKAKAEKRTEPLKPIVTIKKHSLIASSTLLGSGRYWTLVPNGSVIHIPTRLKEKVIDKPKGKLLSWNEFLRANWGWLHVHEIKMSQAKGHKKIDQKSIEAYKSINKIVVATCAKGPISVAPVALEPPSTDKQKDSKNNQDGNKPSEKQTNKPS